MGIELRLVCGFVVGVATAISVQDSNRGCLILLVVPAAMLAYVIWWQIQHPENLRSTSSLDLVFGPLWPSLGALGGYLMVRVIKSLANR
jgi:hypothetical protein